MKIIHAIIIYIYDKTCESNKEKFHDNFSDHERKIHIHAYLLINFIKNIFFLL